MKFTLGHWLSLNYCWRHIHSSSQTILCSLALQTKVLLMPSFTADVTVDNLPLYFSVFGLLDVVITGNRPLFTRDISPGTLAYTPAMWACISLSFTWSGRKKWCMRSKKESCPVEETKWDGFLSGVMSRHNWFHLTKITRSCSGHSDEVAQASAREFLLWFKNCIEIVTGEQLNTWAHFFLKKNGYLWLAGHTTSQAFSLQHRHLLSWVEGLQRMSCSVASESSMILPRWSASDKCPQLKWK